jgi:hypothetical protein
VVRVGAFAKSGIGINFYDSIDGPGEDRTPDPMVANPAKQVYLIDFAAWLATENTQKLPKNGQVVLKWYSFFLREPQRNLEKNLAKRHSPASRKKWRSPASPSLRERSREPDKTRSGRVITVSPCYFFERSR